MEKLSSSLSKQFNFVELFAGSGNISNAFSQAGFNTWKTDIRKRKGICEPDLKIDIQNLHRPLIPFRKIDALWCAVPCTPFSFGSGDYYYKNGTYKPNAEIYLALLEKSISLIRECSPAFYFIENPRGRLQYEKVLRTFLQDTGGHCREITLSSYGHCTTKPTHIFTNFNSWISKPLDPFGRSNRNKTSQAFTNLTLNKRQSTPFMLGWEIAHQLFHHLNSKEKLSNSFGSQFTLF